jgi:hypothetical protein
MLGQTTTGAAQTLLRTSRRFWQPLTASTKSGVALLVTTTALGWSSTSTTTSTTPASLPFLLIGTTTTITQCEGKKNNGGGGSDDWWVTVQAMGDQFAAQAGSHIQGAVDSGIPTQLSYGFVCGYCSGYAAKKVGKAAAGILGKST